MYDIIFVTGEVFFDHPLSGVAILKRLLEKHGYSVGLIENPRKEEDVKELGAPRLFFGITSGCIDSMLRNYTPLKKLRVYDETQECDDSTPDRAVTVYANWIRRGFKGSKMVLGGTEASLRRFVHYDYWDNKLRKPILFDTRADILAYGNSEKQILEIADRISKGLPLENIPGTCIIAKEVPKDAVLLPSFDEVSASKEKFCEMQRLLSNNASLAQKVDNRYMLQHKFPVYTPKDLDEYYELGFSRKTPKELRGFEFSVVTHRGCIGGCNFCSVSLIQGNRVISRSEESILREVKAITSLPHFKGNIDDLGGPSANMYGMDCGKCSEVCLDCKQLDRSNRRWIELLRKVRSVPGVKNVYIKSGVRYDLLSPGCIRELAEHHIFDTLKIAPEHVNKGVLDLMNKNRGNLQEFIKEFRKTRKKLSYYFMMCHPGSTMREAEELARGVRELSNSESVQMFTPSPMTASTCMYYTSINPKTGESVYVPYTYAEKKAQKRLIIGS